MDERAREVERLVEIVDRLRAEDGCPWDREQTLESMVPCALEEAAEVADAVASGDRPAACEELGDLLMNVVLMSRIAEQDGEFSLADVSREITDKLVRRHPHVFEDVVAEDSREVLVNWERIKGEEKPGSRPSKMDGIPGELSSLSRASKTVKRAADVGFEWPDAEAAWRKVEEEFAELSEVREGDTAAREDELGDLLFTLVCVCRHWKLDPDLALRKACSKFERRFRRLEEIVEDPAGADLDRLLLAWQEAKRSEGGAA